MHNFSQLVSDCLDRRRETESGGCGEGKEFFRRGLEGGGKQEGKGWFNGGRKRAEKAEDGKISR